MGASSFVFIVALVSPALCQTKDIKLPNSNSPDTKVKPKQMIVVRCGTKCCSDILDGQQRHRRWHHWTWSWSSWCSGAWSNTEPGRFSADYLFICQAQLFLGRLFVKPNLPIICLPIICQAQSSTGSVCTPDRLWKEEETGGWGGEVTNSFVKFGLICLNKRRDTI